MSNSPTVWYSLRELKSGMNWWRGWRCQRDTLKKTRRKGKNTGKKEKKIDQSSINGRVVQGKSYSHFFDIVCIHLYFPVLISYIHGEIMRSTDATLQDAKKNWPDDIASIIVCLLWSILNLLSDTDSQYQTFLLLGSSSGMNVVWIFFHCLIPSNFCLKPNGTVLVLLPTSLTNMKTPLQLFGNIRFTIPLLS